MKRYFVFGIACVAITVFSYFASSCSDAVNAVYDEHFYAPNDSGADGCLKPEYRHPTFNITQPSDVKFYIEVSGSMNGFYRANIPTDFKPDVWEILNYYSALSDGVTALTNDGNMGAHMTLQELKSYMSAGHLVSAASTKVPIMIQSILDNLDVDGGEVAVLISDMKYSPVGTRAPEVLQSLYSTDMSRIFGDFGKAVCLIGATSNYADKQGVMITDQSPYYYLILGNDEQVAYMRNGISTLLDNRHHFIDNIESGFDYKSPTYTFGSSKYCKLLHSPEPTFVGYKDSCVINLQIHLEDYRWITANPSWFNNAFSAKALYGAEVETADISINVENIRDKQLDRIATADVKLVVKNMFADADVIEWTLSLPETDYTLFAPFLEGATDEDDVTKSYSVDSFMKGMFYGGVVNKTLPANYILISKHN